MNATEALESLKRGDCITSPAHHGCFFTLLDFPDTIHYACRDSGCNACKNKYTIEEFRQLDCEFEVLTRNTIDEI